MTFRTSDKLKGYEMARFFPDNIIEQPENNNYQKKTGYKFTITDRSSLFDYFYGYFGVSKELQKADGSDLEDVEEISIINGACFLIKHMVIKSDGKILYDSDSDDIHRIVNPKKMLEYKDGFYRSVVRKTLWRVYTSEDPDFEEMQILSRDRQNDEMIPLYRYSFFEELKNKMLPPMQLTFELDLNDDDEMIHKAAAYDGRVVVTRLHLCLPRMVPKDGMYGEFVKDFLKPTK